jgi:hypothetical protein
MVEQDDLCMEVQEVRNILHYKNIRLFRDGEREGHTEDRLICTILDPRFEFMNHVVCWTKHKDCAEFIYARTIKPLGALPL